MGFFMSHIVIFFTMLAGVSASAPSKCVAPGNFDCGELKARISLRDGLSGLSSCNDKDIHLLNCDNQGFPTINITNQMFRLLNISKEDHRIKLWLSLFDFHLNDSCQMREYQNSLNREKWPPITMILRHNISITSDCIVDIPDTPDSDRSNCVEKDVSFWSWEGDRIRPDSFIACDFLIGLPVTNDTLSNNFWNTNEGLIQLLDDINGGLVFRNWDSKKKKDKKKDYIAVIISVVAVGAISAAIGLYFWLRWMATHSRDLSLGRPSKAVLLLNTGNATPSFHDYAIQNEQIESSKLQEVPVFSFEVLAGSTSNFNVAYKLGQGGFGPVYMGILNDGTQIAVKRLSRSSGQGLKEFVNEVEVISKLQHRNLVRLLGYCIERDEKMLVYEYMPNTSLDANLFDALKKEYLQWGKRFEIIIGIGRGLLYLHRDSRPHIIHRDLKASNILLDEELNPKISDFGMARIFKNNQNQADTLRVVGTYGYMSPEYAMDGRFSQKSDVYSFGVLMLEIVSGRRNNSFHDEDGALSLIQFAWRLWREGSIEQLIDTVLTNSSAHKEELLRCIHVGFLCVQDSAHDRPSVSTVLSMLSSEITDLPAPKQPAYMETQTSASTASITYAANLCSVDNVTITGIQGR